MTTTDSSNTPTPARTFETDNLGLVSALALQGISPIDRTITAAGRFVFKFVATPQTRDVRSAYESGVLTGPLVHFNTICQSLAAQCKSEHRGRIAAVVAAAGGQQ